MKRVLQVFYSLDCGGAQAMCMNLYRSIDRECVQFDFVKHEEKRGILEDEIGMLGGKVYNATDFSFCNPWKYKTWWNSFLKEHSEYDIIHVHYYTMCLILVPIINHNNRISIAHCHSYVQTSDLKSTVKRTILRLGDGNADYRFACSKTAGNYMFRNKEYAVLKNAIDTQKYIYNPTIRNRIRQGLGIGDHTLVYGTVGRMEYPKNPFFILDFIEALCKSKRDVVFLWIGEGKMYSQITEEARHRGLSANVIFTGFRIDANDYLQAMDIFILPSLYEGLGMAAIEAQASGLPTFCSDTVPKEAAITNLCRFLPIEDVKLWINETEKDICVRQNTSKQIIDAGYDIRENAIKLQRFYLSI